MATTNKVQKSSDGTAVSHLTDSQIYDSGSAVGIGTTSPGGKLEVYDGNLSLRKTDSYPQFQALNYSHDNISLNFDCSWQGDWYSSDAGSNFRIYKVNDKLRISYASGVSAGSQISGWGVDDNVAIVVDSSGRVGMGTVPVVSAGGMQVYCDSDDTLIAHCGYSSGVAVEGVVDGGGGGTGIGVYGLAYQSGETAGKFNHSSSSGKALWVDNGYAIFDGNVGVGVTSPAQKLDVNGGIQVGDTSTATAGTIRFNSGKLQVYQNSAWRDIQVS